MAEFSFDNDGASSVVTGNLELGGLTPEEIKLRKHLNDQCQKILSMPLYDADEVRQLEAEVDKGERGDTSNTERGGIVLTSSDIRILENYVLYRPPHNTRPDHLPRLKLASEMAIIDNLVRERSNALLSCTMKDKDTDNWKAAGEKYDLGECYNNTDEPVVLTEAEMYGEVFHLKSPPTAEEGICYVTQCKDVSIGARGPDVSPYLILDNYMPANATLTNELTLLDNLLQQRAIELQSCTLVESNNDAEREDRAVEKTAECYADQESCIYTSMTSAETTMFWEDEENCLQMVEDVQQTYDEPQPATSKKHLSNVIDIELIDDRVNRILELEQQVKKLQTEVKILKQEPEVVNDQHGCGNYVNNTDNRDGSSNTLQYVILKGESDRYFKKFKLRGRDIKFSFRHYSEQAEQQEDLRNRILWLKGGISEVLRRALDGVLDHYWVGVLLTNDNFPERPVGISFRKRCQVSTDVILDIISAIMQSNKEFFFDDNLRLAVSIVDPDYGFGRQSLTALKNTDYAVYRRKNRGIICIDNNDNLCLARALVLAIELRKPRSGSNSLNEMLKQSTLLSKMAKKLCRDANVDLSNGGGDEELELFQNYLNKYTIVIFSSRNGQTKRFQGPVSDDRIKLYLYYELNHFDVIKNVPAAFGRSFFCDACCVGYNDRRYHLKCPVICSQCHTSPKCVGSVSITCKNCRRDFYGNVCFDRHIKSGLCSKLKRCEKCFKFVWTCKKSKHECGMSYCRYCEKLMPFGHQCYMQCVKDKKNMLSIRKKFLYVFFDFEATQDTKYDKTNNNTFVHKVNLCVVQQACADCINVDTVDSASFCITCGERQRIFETNAVSCFLSYIAEKSTSFAITAIAHNNSNYDGCFILHKLLENVSQWKPKVIRNGFKLLSITCGDNIRFVDSLNFIPLPLSKFPSTFKFEGCKGYFPHLFNTADNHNYAGPLPDKKYYGYNNFHEKEREKFLKWYDEQKKSNDRFIMKYDLVKYCVDDVNILRKACVKFRSIFINLKNIDPFLEALTMPSVCSLVFRKCFLKENTVAIVPFKGYRRAEHQSDDALKWMGWIERTENILIQHSGRGREVRLKNGILVDGFCEQTNTAYQYHGCYWHACLMCNTVQTVNMNADTKKLMSLRRENTIDIEKRIRNGGYNLVVIWGCEFEQMIKSNPDLRAYIRDNTHLFNKTTLNPRDAFFGGRTNAVKLYHKCSEDEKIHYYDFCSLYPYINKYAKYPLGHPKIYVGHEECSSVDFNSLEGLIKCSVLPPNNLYHPLLPCKFNGKLMFTLCRTCMEKDNKDPCTHNESERLLSGTWTTDEIKEALLLGYQLINIDEIWHYEVEQYNPETKQGGLFTEYINTFLKLKQESSGWPTWVKSDEDKDEYIQKYLEKEGIQLERDNIVNNPGLRYISKLLLNSFWGKFGEKENKMHTKIVCDSEDMYRILNDPAVVVHDMTIINPDALLVTWDCVEQEVESGKNSNIVLAVMTTAAARLRLYKYLNMLDRRVLYFDTDSIIFTSKPGETLPIRGDFLGMFTDEVEAYGEGSYITEFVSAGPKNYAFQVYTPSTGKYNTVCKVKGITLNYENSKVVNFSSMLDIVCNGVDEIVTHNDKKIARTKTYDVISRPESKIYRLNYTKRKRIPDSYNTLPFGFKE